MFQEIERTYRTALEEDFKWTMNFLKVVIIILLVSSCALLIKTIIHATVYPFPGTFGVFYFEFSIAEFFGNFFAIIATYVTYPAALVLAVLVLKLIRYFPREEKGKLLASAILLLSVLGLSIFFGLIRIIYVVSTDFPYSSFPGYDKLNAAATIVFYFIDYLAIAATILMLSLSLKNQKEFGGYTGNMQVSPIIVLSLLGLWMFLVILFFSMLSELTGNKLLITTIVIACLSSAAMIGMFAEFLVNMKNIQVPQIIALKEKLA